MKDEIYSKYHIIMSAANNIITSATSNIIGRRPISLKIIIQHIIISFFLLQ